MPSDKIFILPYNTHYRVVTMISKYHLWNRDHEPTCVYAIMTIVTQNLFLLQDSQEGRFCELRWP